MKYIVTNKITGQKVTVEANIRKSAINKAAKYFFSMESNKEIKESMLISFLSVDTEEKDICIVCGKNIAGFVRIENKEGNCVKCIKCGLGVC